MALAWVPPVPVTVPSICESLSAVKSAADTRMLYEPSASAEPVKALPLTFSQTVSPAAYLPVTLPVIAMLPVFSEALKMLSAVTGLIDSAVLVSVLPASSV